MTASKQLHTKQIAQNKFLCKHQVLNRTVTHQFLIKSLFLPDFPQKNTFAGVSNTQQKVTTTPSTTIELHRVAGEWKTQKKIS